MDAAGDLIRERGLSSLRIEDVAQRASLSVGTFYLYFKGKADLFVEVVLQQTERLRARLKAVYAATGTVRERLAKAQDTYLDFVLENERGFLPFVHDASALETDLGRLSTWVFEAHAEDLLPLIAEGIDNGELRATDAHLAAQALVGLNQHLAVYWLEHPDVCSRQQLKAFLGAFIAFGMVSPGDTPRGVSPRSAPRRRKGGRRTTDGR